MDYFSYWLEMSWATIQYSFLNELSRVKGSNLRNDRSEMSKRLKTKKWLSGDKPVKVEGLGSCLSGLTISETTNCNKFRAVHIYQSLKGKTYRYLKRAQMVYNRLSKMGLPFRGLMPYLCKTNILSTILYNLPIFLFSTS